MSDLKSTVIFISNLYPVEKKYTMDDTIFCQHVEEPNALFKMKCNPRFKWFNFTKRQELIFARQSGWKPDFCPYKDGDKPFGAVVSENGLIKEICKCKRVECKHFKECKEI